MTHKILALALLLALLSLTCAEEAEPEPAGCACPDEVCAQGQCVLKIVVNDACWGEAKIFVGDIGADAEPVGTASVGRPFTTCEPFDAPVFRDNGEVVQEAEPFQFVVESEDGRALAGAISGQTFRCAGSAPFVFNADLCQ